MDAVTNTKPFVRKPVNCEEIEKRAIRMDLEPAPEGKYDISDMTVFDPNSEEQKNAARRLFCPLYLSKNENLFNDYQHIETESKQAISSYYDGSMSEEELGETFFNELVSFLTACDQNDYPCILGMSDLQEKSAVEVFYSEFRYKIISEALKRNRLEGNQYVQGEPYASQRSGIYYNSDYYYQSEKALSAIEKSVLNFAKLQGYEDFELPDYEANGQVLYNNFNTALFNPFCTNGAAKYFSDPNQVPPEHFQFFFQTGGTSRGYAAITSIMVGDVPVYTSEQDSSFDPANPNKGTMWAAYKDEKGVTHKISHDITFNGTRNDYYSVFDLMCFQNGEEDSLYNDFLKSFSVYPTGYYNRNLVGTLNMRG